MTNEIDPVVEQELKRQLDILSFGTFEITPEDEFVQILRESIVQKKPLRVKCGIDPTSSDIHLGHTVPFKKMRQFQDLGHIGVVIIGDYTASIGDPTGRNEARPPLSYDQIKLNARSYMDQMYSVLDRDRTEVYFQSEWYEDKTLKDVILWAAETTVAKLLSHETFKERLEGGKPLSLHELFYPVLQGLDSVYVTADVELGGTDQKFNVLMGRDYQKERNQRPQVAILMPIITGTCGTQKMSKSLGNTIGILDDPFDKFGKIMSIPDAIMMEYWQHLTPINSADFLKLKDDYNTGAIHPNELKKNLASKIVEFFHGNEEGQKMREKFESVFKNKQVPDDVLEYQYKRGIDILSLMVDSGLLPSKKEGRRMIDQKAVQFVDGDKIENPSLELDESFKNQVLKIGKRKFLKLV